MLVQRVAALAFGITLFIESLAGTSVGWWVVMVLYLKVRQAQCPSHKLWIWLDCLLLFITKILVVRLLIALDIEE